MRRSKENTFSISRHHKTLFAGEKKHTHFFLLHTRLLVPPDLLFAMGAAMSVVRSSCCYTRSLEKEGVHRTRELKKEEDAFLLSR